jgi:hypothetical protein
MRETPELNMRFVDISNIAFQTCKKDVIVTDADTFNIGYRHMCSFWFVNFWDAVKEYDRLLRIDEDCYIDFNIDAILSDLNTHTFIVGRLSDDAEFVTRGLNCFSLDFVNRYTNIFTFKKNDVKKPGGPYTNIIGLSLDRIRSNDIFQKYREEIDRSNMIYERRWGDLPLWGEVIYYIFGDDTLKVDKGIRYVHESHGMQVN